ncbi:MAG: Rpn family recombination-promoting nuclease/putative transposase [Thiolinea sp.]
MKDTYVDVKAVCANGNTVIIEMQVLNVEGFGKRILYNAAKTYSAQLGKGEKYHLLNPVIALTLTDFVMFLDQPRSAITVCWKKQTLAQYKGRGSGAGVHRVAQVHQGAAGADQHQRQVGVFRQKCGQL